MTLAPLERVDFGRARPAWATACVTVLFGVFGILGTYTGNNVFHSYANLRAMSRPTIAVTIPIYGFVASVLPVWLLLCPRDYLSTYLKVGTIAALAIGIFWVHPQLVME